MTTDILDVPARVAVLRDDGLAGVKVAVTLAGTARGEAHGANLAGAVGAAVRAALAAWEREHGGAFVRGRFVKGAKRAGGARR